MTNEIVFFIFSEYQNVSLAKDAIMAYAKLHDVFTPDSEDQAIIDSLFWERWPELITQKRVCFTISKRALQNVPLKSKRGGNLHRFIS